MAEDVEDDGQERSAEKPAVKLRPVHNSFDSAFDLGSASAGGAGLRWMSR